MNLINITDFKQNIWTYFDNLISSKKPLYIQRRKHSAIIVPLDGLSDEDIKNIENIRNLRNTLQVEVEEKEWVDTFNKISWNKQDKYILW